MIQFIGIVAGAYVVGFICSFIYGECRFRKACEQDLTECPPHSDSEEYASRLSRFMAVRAWICNLRRLQDPSPDIRKHSDKFRMPGRFAEDVYLGNSPLLKSFVRLCHALGCTVIMRQTSFAERRDDKEVVAAMDKKYHCTEYMINSKLDERLRNL